MGYSHYFKQRKDCPQAQWDQLCAGVRDMFARLPAGTLCFEMDKPGEPPVADDACIRFNAPGANGHETFMLRRVNDPDAFDGFCKTAEKPYDRAVVAVLCMANVLCKGVWSIASDGNRDQWSWITGHDLAAEVLRPGKDYESFPFPAGVKKRQRV